jgi:hypothetical protein
MSRGGRWGGRRRRRSGLRGGSRGRRSGAFRGSLGLSRLRLWRRSVLIWRGRLGGGLGGWIWRVCRIVWWWVLVWLLIGLGELVLVFVLLHIFRCSICRDVQSLVVVRHAWPSSHVRCLVKGAPLRWRCAHFDARVCSLRWTCWLQSPDQA